MRYLPTRLGSVPRLLHGTLRPDVLIGQRSVQGAGAGLVFGGEDAGSMRATVDAGATVLAEVNHGLPNSSDGIPVTADRVVVVAETDRPPHRFTTNPPDDVADAIAAHAAALIPEGATLQYGPGTVADAILRAITVPVAVDSGLIGDAILDLDARGLLIGTPTAPTSPAPSRSTSGRTDVRCSNRSRSRTTSAASPRTTASWR